MDRIRSHTVDMIFCDPPYGGRLGYLKKKKHVRRASKFCWDSQLSVPVLWEQYRRIIKNGGAIILMSVQPFTSKLIVSNLKMFKCELIWKKEQGCNQFNVRYHPLKQHENIVVFSKGKTNYYPQSQKDSTGRYPTSILEVNREFRNRLHTAQKPLALVLNLVELYTKKGDLVLDNCMGSGTTGVACKILKRGFIGIEKSKKYFTIAKKRIKEA